MSARTAGAPPESSLRRVISGYTRFLLGDLFPAVRFLDLGAGRLHELGDPGLGVKRCHSGHSLHTTFSSGSRMYGIRRCPWIQKASRLMAATARRSW